MNHCVYSVLNENSRESLSVTDIRFVEWHVFPDDFLYTSQSLFLRINQIVYDNDIVAGLVKLDDSVRAYEPGTSCKKYFHYICFC